jgi:peptidoglycan-N-acetylglucosamine deacetylase
MRRSVAGIGLAAGLGYLLPSITAGAPPTRRIFGVRDRVSAGVALTFDDGPHPEGTPAALELLARAGAKATFFLVGEQVERRPQLAARIAAEGHEVGLHCHRHTSLLLAGPQRTRDDLLRAQAAIEAATGRCIRVYRPPYGVLNAAALLTARRNGWETWLWRREGRDWEDRATAASIAARLLRRVRGGDVLLLHDADFYSGPESWRRMTEALPLVLAGLDRRGLAPRCLIQPELETMPAWRR